VGPAGLRSSRALAIGIVASTTQLIAHELTWSIESEVQAIVDRVSTVPPSDPNVG
jgi:hypothetical protein